MKNVFIELKKETINGLLVKEDEKHIVLKLSSGYNIGISKNKIQNVEYKEMEENKIDNKNNKSQATNVIQNTNLPKVLIIHTGGTIASKVDYRTGGAIAAFSPEEIVSMFPELKELAHIESHLFRNMWSEDLRFVHYNLIAEKIAEEIRKDPQLKGIIITHGTDTIHYTTAALSFMFEHLSIPVVIVGSQRSSDRGSSDAAINLVSAVAFIANTTLSGIFICMHENMNDNTCSILNGINAKKLHSSRRDAFKQINGKPVARVNYFTKEIEYIAEYPNSTLNSPGKLKIHPYDEKLKIGVLYSHINMFADEIQFYSNNKFDGLILAGTGLTNFPINEIDEYTKEHSKIRAALADLASKIPVVMSLQTVYGRVNMNVYTTGRDIAEMGIIGNFNSLCTETSFIKLAWLLSQKLDPKEWFMKDVRGEFSVKEMESD